MRGVGAGSGQRRLCRGSSQLVRDVLFPRSCFLTRNRFFSLVKWLHDALEITVGYKCTRADDTRTTTEIQNLPTDTYDMSALCVKRIETHFFALPIVHTTHQVFNVRNLGKRTGNCSRGTGLGTNTQSNICVTSQNVQHKESSAAELLEFFMC